MSDIGCSEIPHLGVNGEWSADPSATGAGMRDVGSGVTEKIAATGSTAVLAPTSVDIGFGTLITGFDKLVFLNKSIDK